VKEALPASAQGKKLEIWFQDEARVGQKGTLTRLWAKRGTRPRATRDTRYEWAYIFGAVCPERSIGAALIMPYADGAALNAHLREIAFSVAADAHAVLVLDGAGWHGWEGLQIPNNITLLTLPAYAPAQSGRERLGIPAQEQARQSAPYRLRGHRLRLLPSLERSRRKRPIPSPPSLAETGQSCHDLCRLVLSTAMLG
jgi:hypothetical protein